MTERTIHPGRLAAGLGWRIALLAAVLAAVWQGAEAAEPGSGSAPAGDRDRPDGIHVVDGSYVMNVGNLHMNITNHGLIGSRYTQPTTFSEAPSGQWPGGSGVEYLWAAGLWVGGVLGSEQLVSTGQYAREIRPQFGPENTIYEARGGRVVRPVATFHAVIDRVDARDVPAQKLTPDEIRPYLASLTGMTIDGTVSAAGKAGDTTYAVEKPEPSTREAIESVKLLLPTWVPLPAEPVGTGATWEVSVPVVINSVATTHVTTYKLVSRSAKGMTISGETKVSGADQPLQGAEVSKIAGSGRVDATFEAGKLYPKLKRTSSTKLHLKLGSEEVDIEMNMGSAFAPR
jgi:hypothetical protein